MPESQPPAAASTCPLCGGSGTHDLTGTDLMFGGDTRYDYDRCSRCGLVYLNPLPTPEQIATFYPDSYSIYTEPRRPHFSRRALLTLKYRLGYDHLEVRPGRGLLDRLRPWKKVEHVVPWVAGGRFQVAVEDVETVAAADLHGLVVEFDALARPADRFQAQQVFTVAAADVQGTACSRNPCRRR